MADEMTPEEFNADVADWLEAYGRPDVAARSLEMDSNMGAMDAATVAAEEGADLDADGVETVAKARIEWVEEHEPDDRGGPVDRVAAERGAIREALDGTDVHILRYHGGEPSVALVRRESPPSTEYPGRGERVVLVEWHGAEDYALSVAEGDTLPGGNWEIVDRFVSCHDSRSEAIEAARELLA